MAAGAGASIGCPTASRASMPSPRPNAPQDAHHGGPEIAEMRRMARFAHAKSLLRALRGSVVKPYMRFAGSVANLIGRKDRHAELSAGQLQDLPLGAARGDRAA